MQISHNADLEKTKTYLYFSSPNKFTTGFVHKGICRPVLGHESPPIVSNMLCVKKTSSKFGIRTILDSRYVNYVTLQLELTYHTSVIPWIYFGSAIIIGYIYYVYNNWFLPFLMKCFRTTRLPHSMPFLRLLYDSWFSRSWWQVLWFVCSNGFHYIIKKDSCYASIGFWLLLYFHPPFFWYKNYPAPCCALMWIEHEFLFGPRGNWIINIGPYVVILQRNKLILVYNSFIFKS